MAKIDINAIEGYAEMSAEEKLAALESFEIPEPDFTGYVKKELLDKASSEAASFKKQLREKMTEEEAQEMMDKIFPWLSDKNKTEKGFDFIQTDWPIMLKMYLEYLLSVDKAYNIHILYILLFVEINIAAVILGAHIIYNVFFSFIDQSFKD